MAAASAGGGWRNKAWRYRRWRLKAAKENGLGGGINIASKTSALAAEKPCSCSAGGGAAKREARQAAQARQLEENMLAKTASGAEMADITISNRYLSMKIWYQCREAVVMAEMSKRIINHGEKCGGGRNDEEKREINETNTARN